MNLKIMRKTNGKLYNPMAIYFDETGVSSVNMVEEGKEPLKDGWIKVENRELHQIQFIIEVADSEYHGEKTEVTGLSSNE